MKIQQLWGKGIMLRLRVEEVIGRRSEETWKMFVMVSHLNFIYKLLEEVLFSLSSF